MKFLLLFFVMLVAFSCTKDEVNSERFEGKYKGYYARGADTANVEIEFSNAYFIGKSDKSFPELCSGQVLQQKDVVYFSNTCTSSPSIDVLSGNYYYYLKDNNLSFWRTQNGVTAYYKLTK